jgi:thiol-disulfide isomerase/thioredoxin
LSEGPFGRRSGPAPDEPVEAPPRPRPGPPKPPANLASSATWILGVALVLAVTYITINTLTSSKPGSRGIAVGMTLPPFAVPLATSDLVGDSNVSVKARDGVPKACDVHDARAFTSCSLAAKGPVVLGFFATRSERCLDEIDVINRLQARYPDVAFAAISVKGNRDDVRGLVRDRRWTLPVGYDRDGAIANAYAVAVCPTITFARRGGKVTHTTLGEATEAEIVRDIEAARG